MPDDPFERWRQGRPYGSYRQTAGSGQGVVPVPVVKDPAHRIYFANGVFALSEPSVDGARVQVSFDYLSKQRDVVFLVEDPIQSEETGTAANDMPPPNSGIVQSRITELCSVELPATIAAQLARLLIERLAATAPDALKAVGLEFRANADG